MISNRHKLTLSIVIAITMTGCASNISSGKYSDQTIINSMAENNTSLKVTYVQNLDAGESKTILASDSVNVQTASLLNSPTNGEELYELAGLDTPVVKDSSTADVHTYNVAVKSRPNLSTRTNIEKSVAVSLPLPKVAITKDFLAPMKVVTAKDKIMSLTINPLDYQYTPEFTHLSVNKNTDRVWMSVDDVKVKEYLLDEESRLDPKFETDSRKPVRPIAKVHFKVIKGSLKANLEALLSATNSTELVYKASLNHYFYNDFELEGDSVLKVVDRIIEPFKTPHQVVGMAYVNDIFRAYTKNN